MKIEDEKFKVKAADVACADGERNFTLKLKIRFLRKHRPSAFALSVTASSNSIIYYPISDPTTIPAR